MMKRAYSITLLFTLLSVAGFGQSTKKILDAYVTKLKGIHIASYQVQRIDTFTSGDVWNHQGKCILMRDKKDKLLGYQFFGVRSDVDKENLYDGSSYFEIDRSNKTYRAANTPSKGILGSPGGQMVVEELNQLDTTYQQISHYRKKGVYVVRLDYPDNPEHDITNHYKLIHLDPSTFLPVRTETHLTKLEKRWVTVMLISNLLTNDLTLASSLSNKEFLTEYTQETPQRGNDLAQLIDQKAFPFQLPDLEGSMVNLANYKGKMVLLDFWDVWCGPCLQSMPKLQRLYEQYQKQGLIVLGIVTNQRNKDSAKLVVQKKGVTFSNLLGDEATSQHYKAMAIPEYVLIDESGKIVYAQAGYNQQLEDLLKEKYKP